MMAEKWGCPPWEITGENLNIKKRLRWFLRWMLYTEQVNKNMQEKGTGGS